MLSTVERPADAVQSSFQARIDSDLCAACGTCVERCQLDAIIEGDEFMEIETARCIGCGLCVPTCPEEAVSLVGKTGVESPAANVSELWMRMAEERK